MQRITITCLQSLVEPLLMPLLAELGIEPISRHEHYGFESLFVECDKATAAKIKERFYVTKNEVESC